MLCICLHKGIALQNAPICYNFALLSPVRFSEFEGENSLPVDPFSTVRLNNVSD